MTVQISDQLLGADSELVALVAEFEPMLRRAVSLDAEVNVRLQGSPQRLSAYIWLPFDVLVGRTVSRATELNGPTKSTDSSDPGVAVDLTVGAAALLSQLADPVTSGSLPRRDVAWRGGTPPRHGWQRIDTVPADVVHSLVRSGARTLAEAAQREGSQRAEPRAAVTAALLDSTVLSVSGEEAPNSVVEVSLRMVSALARMNFLRPAGHIAVDRCGRWTRIAADYGNVYRERPGLALGITPVANRR